MKAIFKREFASYLHSAFGIVFIALLLMIGGIAFSLYNLFFQNADFNAALQIVCIALILLMPLLAMRSFAEDKRAKTDKLLLSLPLSAGQIVLGKYFAMLCMLAIPTAIFCLFPVLLLIFGRAALYSSYVGILNFFLLGAAVAAVCVFISTHTDNVPAAAAISIGVLAALFAVRYLLRLLPTGVANVLSVLSLFGRNTAATGGIFDLTVPLYYIGFTLFFLFATVISAERQRRN